MSSIKRDLIKRYYDSRSACQVLGILMAKPKLLLSIDYNLDKEDFVGAIHKTLFACIYNLAHKGINSINLTDIENYLHNTDSVGYAKMFEKFDGSKWILDILQDANIDNFDYYYELVRKYSLLRSYLKAGIEVKDILDLTEMDSEILDKQQKEFEELTSDEIIRYFDRQNMKSKERFLLGNQNASRKSGDGADELYEIVKQSPSYGYGLDSDYLNAVVYGALGGRAMLESRDSGTGKTRSAIKRLVKLCSPYLWSNKEKKFIPNPNGQNNAGLYIGTEMDVYREIEPMIWCFIANVDEKSFKEGKTTKEEEERIIQAKEYSKQSKIFLEDMEDFDVNYLWQIAEKYSTEQNIKMIVLDYVELNSALAVEYIHMAKGMNVREDMILLNLSKNIKSIAKRFDLFFIAYTQVNDEGRSKGYRDQTAVKGGKSLPNKMDFGLTAFEPTKRELDILQPLILKYSKGIRKKLIPNLCLTIYKNRWFEKKDVKIWVHQDLGTGEVIDCFCTDKNYKYLEINPVSIDVKQNESDVDDN